MRSWYHKNIGRIIKKMSLDNEINIISGFSMDDGNVPDTNITVETGKEGQVVSLNNNLNVIDDIDIIQPESNTQQKKLLTEETSSKPSTEGIVKLGKQPEKQPEKQKHNFKREDSFTSAGNSKQFWKLY